MAPEHPPYLVIFDGRIESGDLRGTCEYIEPKTPGSRLRVCWAVESQPDGSIPVGGGVAYLERGADFEILPRRNVEPPSLDTNRYRWTEGLNYDIPWVMFIFILPAGYTLAETSPAPAGTRVFQNRIALYWMLEGNKIGRTQIEWTLSPLKRQMKEELIRLNRLVSGTAPTETASLTIEDRNKASSTRNAAVQRNPWVSGTFYLVAAVVIFGVLTVLSLKLPVWALPVVLIAGLLSLVAIGALQLRNDEALSDESFLRLMLETLKRLPLLKAGRGGTRTR